MSIRTTISLALTFLIAGVTLAQESTPLPYSVSPAETSSGNVPSAGLGEGSEGWLSQMWATVPLPGSEGKWWFSGEYLFNYFRATHLPALVTTSPAGTPQVSAGVLGVKGTSVLFGDRDVNEGLRAGFRITSGFWFSPEQKLGVEFGFTITEDQAEAFAANSNRTPIIARPFTDATTGAQSSVLVAFPGSSEGSISARANSGNFFGGHVDLVEKSLDCGWFRLYSLFGYKTYYLSDGVQFHQTLLPTSPFVLPGSQITSNDSFSAHNVFNGLDMGLRPEFYWKNFSLEVLGKVALGNLRSEVNISGNTVTTTPGFATVTSSGGVLALRGNIGTFSDRQWWSLPEGGAAVNWQVSPNIKLRAGYSILVLNGVVRASDQLDTTVNPNLFPGSGTTGGPNRPAFNLQRQDIWIQSVNVGMTFTY